MPTQPSVADGELDTLILPHVNGDCMQLFLDEVAARHPDDRIVMVLDGAGWHQSQGLAPPVNLRLFKLPPYSPELNPVGHLWDELREKSFRNLVFDSLDALEGHLESALREMENDITRVQSIVAWPWIIKALLNWKWNYTWLTRSMAAANSRCYCDVKGSTSVGGMCEP